MPYTVAASFDRLLEDLKLTERQKDIANGRINHLKTFLPVEFDVPTGPWTIGSYGRETLIRWQRDIDVMVALSVSSYWNRYQGDSAAFLTWVRDRLNREYANTRVSTRQISVRMYLADDLQVDLVPGFHRTGGGYLIPNGHGLWMPTNPPFHDNLMSSSNTRLGGQLKPLVRLLKAWNECNGSHLQSFHLEMAVERAWRSATSLPGARSTQVAETLSVLPSWIRTPMADPWTDNTTPIDAYLSQTERDTAVRMLTDDAKNAADALASEAASNHAKAIEQWNVVFYKRFPSYG